MSFLYANVNLQQYKGNSTPTMNHLYFIRTEEATPKIQKK